MANYTRDPPKEVSLPLRLPLVGLPNQRGSSADEDSRLVNAYVEFGQDEVLRVVKRPGLTEIITAAGFGAGMFEEYSVFYEAVTDAWEAKVYQDDTLIGSLGTYGPRDTAAPERFFYFNRVQTALRETAVLFHDQYSIWTYNNTDGLETLPYSGASTVGPDSYTLTAGSTEVTKGAPSTAGLLKYSSVSGTGITTGTLIESIDTSLILTLSLPVTATGLTGLTFTLSGPPDQTIDGRAKLAAGVEDLNTSSYLLTTYNGVVGSDPVDPRAWDPLNIIYAYADLADAVRIAKNLSYLVVFKETSTEFFRDVGVSPGSPLERLEGLRLAVGCWAARTVCEVDGSLLWCSFTETGIKSVYIMTNLKTDEIATLAIRRVLNSIEPQYAIAFSVSGHSFYVLTDPTAGVSLVYDITSKIWSYWNALGEAYFPFVAASYVPRSPFILGDGGTRLQHESNGKIYRMEPDTFLDDGEVITMDIYTPLFDANMRQTKYVERMYINADQEDGSILKLRTNDDDQADSEWTDYREFDLGHPRPALYDCGSFTKRNFHFRHESPTACRLVSVELDLLPGTL
jgi:hypothetical protein